MRNEGSYFQCNNKRPEGREIKYGPQNTNLTDFKEIQVQQKSSQHELQFSLESVKSVKKQIFSRPKIIPNSKLPTEFIHSYRNISDNDDFEDAEKLLSLKTALLQPGNMHKSRSHQNMQPNSIPPTNTNTDTPQQLIILQSPNGLGQKYQDRMNFHNKSQNYYTSNMKERKNSKYTSNNQSKSSQTLILNGKNNGIIENLIHSSTDLLSYNVQIQHVSEQSNINQELHVISHPQDSSSNNQLNRHNESNSHQKYLSLQECNFALNNSIKQEKVSHSKKSSDCGSVNQLTGDLSEQTCPSLEENKSQCYFILPSSSNKWLKSTQKQQQIIPLQVSYDQKRSTEQSKEQYLCFSNRNIDCQKQQQSYSQLKSQQSSLDTIKYPQVLEKQQQQCIKKDDPHVFKIHYQSDLSKEIPLNFCSDTKNISQIQQQTTEQQLNNPNNNLCGLLQRRRQNISMLDEPQNVNELQISMKTQMTKQNENLKQSQKQLLTASKNIIETQRQKDFAKIQKNNNEKTDSIRINSILGNPFESVSEITQSNDLLLKIKNINSTKSIPTTEHIEPEFSKYNSIGLTGLISTPNLKVVQEKTRKTSFSNNIMAEQINCDIKKVLIIDDLVEQPQNSCENYKKNYSKQQGQTDINQQKNHVNKNNFSLDLRPQEQYEQSSRTTTKVNIIQQDEKINSQISHILPSCFTKVQINKKKLQQKHSYSNHPQSLTNLHPNISISDLPIEKQLKDPFKESKKLISRIFDDKELSPKLPTFNYFEARTIQNVNSESNLLKGVVNFIGKQRKGEQLSTNPSFKEISAHSCSNIRAQSKSTIQFEDNSKKDIKNHNSYIHPSFSPQFSNLKLISPKQIEPTFIKQSKTRPPLIIKQQSCSKSSGVDPCFLFQKHIESSPNLFFNQDKNEKYPQTKLENQNNTTCQISLQEKSQSSLSNISGEGLYMEKNHAMVVKDSLNSLKINSEEYLSLIESKDNNKKQFIPKQSSENNFIKRSIMRKCISFKEDTVSSKNRQISEMLIERLQSPTQKQSNMQVDMQKYLKEVLEQQKKMKMNELITIKQISKHVRKVLHVSTLQVYILRQLSMNSSSYKSISSMISNKRNLSEKYPNFFNPIYRVFSNTPENHISIISKYLQLFFFKLNLIYICHRYQPLKSLKHIMNCFSTINERSLQQIIVQLVQILSCLKTQDYANFDINFDNILFDEDGNIKLDCFSHEKIGTQYQQLVRFLKTLQQKQSLQKAIPSNLQPKVMNSSKEIKNTENEQENYGTSIQLGVILMTASLGYEVLYDYLSVQFSEFAESYVQERDGSCCFFHAILKGKISLYSKQQLTIMQKIISVQYTPIFIDFVCKCLQNETIETLFKHSFVTQTTILQRNRIQELFPISFKHESELISNSQTELQQILSSLTNSLPNFSEYIPLMSLTQKILNTNHPFVNQLHKDLGLAPWNILNQLKKAYDIS